MCCNYCKLHFFIRPNTYPHLFSFWGSEFPPRSTIFDIISFYVKSFPNFSGLFIPNQYLNMEIKLAILFVILVGLIRLLNSFVQKEQIHSELFILICLPFLSLIAANIMGKYPYGATKVNFFIFPVFLILFVYGIICFRNLLQWLLGKDFGEIIEYSFQTLCIFTAMIFLYLVSLSNVEIEDAKEAVKYLRDNIGVEDSLYVHASMVEQFKLYCRMLNCVNGTYYYGKTGAPCCVRKENIDLRNNAYDLQNDLHSFMRYNKVKTRWFLFTGRSAHWNRIGRDESEIIGNIFKSVNCEEKLRKSFYGVLIYSFNCN